MNLAEFIIQVESFNANINIPLIRKAYEFSDRAHAGQYRESGDPFVEHCLNVAFILAEHHMDSDTIAAGLLHDVIEDAKASPIEIKREFGDDIAEMVDGLTKMSGLKFGSLAEQQVVYFRKMLLSMARDIRVIVIKFADRLHNMRTLDPLPERKRQRIALETLEIYAPLAHRFGMAKIKWELEDLAFKYLHPDDYSKIEKMIADSREEREHYITELSKPLVVSLSNSGVKSDIMGRAKHHYSVYRKIKIRKVPFEQIFDLIAMRVIVDTVTDCYHALGIIHSMWPPVPDRFHDYIANPKSNMIAAHWLYKEGKKTHGEIDKHMAWIREILDWQKDMANPEEFLEFLKIDLFSKDIFVYTPAGDLRQLPAGSTPLDFAFAVHSDIGFHCAGAKINGKFANLATELQSGDEIEIKTSANQSPSNDWLKIVKTARAKSKIKRWLRQKGHEQAISLGKEILERELKKKRISMPSDAELSDLAAMVGQTNVEQMCAGLGSGSISVQTLLNKLKPAEEKEEEPTLVRRFIDHARGVSKGIRVSDVGNLMFRFASCCQPVPGEKIIGYVTRGRGLTIHRSDCKNIAEIYNEPERKMDVEITEAVSDADVDVRGAEIKRGPSPVVGWIVVEVQNYGQLTKVMDKVKKLKGVASVIRDSGSDKS
jgi:GTP pyrophosphokinase